MMEIFTSVRVPILVLHANISYRTGMVLQRTGSGKYMGYLLKAYIIPHPNFYPVERNGAVVELSLLLPLYKLWL